MSSTQNNNFRFFIDNITIEKGKDDAGKDVMKIGGIASTKDKDSDGEEIDPTGFDVQYFLDHGFFNYNHQAKLNPKAIVGEPTKAKATKDGLYVEGILYPDSELAKSVYDTAKMLESSSSTRRMGFSIEGSALERDPFNPKKISKARLTGCALTLNPKNPNTLVNILKGEYHDEPFVYDEQEVTKSVTTDIEKGKESNCIVYLEKDGKVLEIDKDFNIRITEKGTDISKSMTTANAGMTVKEDVDQGPKITEPLGVSKKQLSKGEVYSEIFSYIYDNDLEKADLLFRLTEQIALKQGKDMISKDDIQKAIDIVTGGLPNDLEKGKKHEASETPAEEVAEKEKMEKAAKMKEEMEKAMSEDKKYQELKKSYDEAEKAMNEYKEKIEKGEISGYPNAPAAKEESMIENPDATTVGNQGAVGSSMNKSEEVANDLVKGLQDSFEKSQLETNELIKSLNASMQSVLEHNQTLSKQNDELKKSLDATIDKVAKLEATPIPAKSVTPASYRQHPTLEKSHDATRPQLHVGKHKAQIIEMLDKKAALDSATPNMQYAKEVMSFEQTGMLSKSIAADLMKSENIDIIGL